jgi:hypothetical protein
MIALLGVRDLLHACSTQYKKIESLMTKLAIADVNPAIEVVKISEQHQQKLSCAEINLIMSICVELED